MRTVGVYLLGKPPLRGDVQLGGDGQLWRWTERGQELVASSGAAAVAYAIENGWPDDLVNVVRWSESQQSRAAAQRLAEGGRRNGR